MRFFSRLTGGIIRDRTVSQTFSLTVRNCTGFFVTLWKHRWVYLHSAGMEHRFFTAKWYDRHHRHRKYGFHIRKNVHIDIARYVPWCTQLKLRHNAPLPCTAWDNILRSRIFYVYPAEPSSLRCNITTYPLIIWLKIIVTQGESPNLTRRFSVARSTSTHRNTHG